MDINTLTDSITAISTGAGSSGANLVGSTLYIRGTDNNVIILNTNNDSYTISPTIQNGADYVPGALVEIIYTIQRFFVC